MLPITALADTAENVNEVAANNKMERLSNELQLTADQKAKLEAIFNERHEKIRSIREETQNSIKEVLSEEQFITLEAMKKNRFKKQHGTDGR